MKSLGMIATVLFVLSFLVAGTSIGYGACSTALLVMDMQNMVFGPLSPWYTETGEDLIPAIAELISIARSAGIPIIYMRDLSMDSPSLDPTMFAVVDELKPLEGDAMLTKVTPSAFINDEVGEYLDEQRIRRILLCGLSSTGCVQATLLAGIREGYEMVVIADAHSAGTVPQRAKERNHVWRGRGIDCPTTADIDWSSFGCVANP